MDSYQSFQSVFNMGLVQVWQQVLQQQLQQDHPLHQSHPMPTLATYAMAEWLEQQQNPHHQEAIASPAWHLPPPTLPPPPPPPPQHQRHDQQSLTSQILPRRPNEAPADESALKWRHLPATLRRRASAQAASALLKAWMRQHADNPYPSKREKSALAALTNMSFAQISTWFANARRRLKKDANGSSNGSEFSSSSGSGEGGAGRTTDSSKPRIWSLVETALKDDASSPERAAAAAAAVTERDGISAAEAAAVDEAALSCWGRNCLSSRCSGYSSLSN
ncbi:hypothetical protein BOX15_Mlig016389g1 [Macrostomum lignano]|uniref:Homeobox domain-containing protein n=1 Tax=Macrostomum lignano TaxID=282301 RepID=A0A267GR89_9PLAT|nr:hypothetical protein BOX15_Mlig016389g1 [Macrostomum lignano]